MIVDRYKPMNLFEIVPKLNLQMEPELVQLDKLLDDDELFSLSGESRSHPALSQLRKTRTALHTCGGDLEDALVVKKLHGFSYEQTERFLSDSIVLRQFCRLYLESAPDDTTLIRWANQIGPQTLAALK